MLFPQSVVGCTLLLSVPVRLLVGVVGLLTPPFATLLRVLVVAAPSSLAAAPSLARARRAASAGARGSEGDVSVLRGGETSSHAPFFR